MKGISIQNLLDAAPDSIIIVDSNGIIRFANARTKDLFGYEKVELEGKPIEILLPDQFTKSHVKQRETYTNLPKIRAMGHPGSELYGKRKDGEEIRVEISLSPIHTEEFGNGVFAAIRDISERVKIQKELKNSKEFVFLTNVIPQIVWTATADGKIDFFNQRWTEFTGNDPENSLGENWLSFLIPASKEEISKNWYHAINSGKTFEMEIRLKNKREEFKWFVAKGIPVFHEETNLIKWVGTFSDVDDHKNLEKNFFESDRKYRSFIEGIREYAIFMLDPTGLITSWNKGMEELYGYSSNEMIGKHISIFYPKDSSATNNPHETELIKAREIGAIETEGWRLKKDGTLFWANVVVSAIKDNNGKLIGFSKITRDMTLRKNMEDRLRKTNADLDTFVYAASHDLKTPIYNIEGLLNAISDEMTNSYPEEITGMFEMIQNSVDKLKITINELAKVSHIQKIVEEDVEEVYLYEILEAFIITHQDWIEKTGVCIETDFKIRKIKFSKKYLRSIFDNLLSNSIKYRSSDRQGRIFIETWIEGEFSVIKVEDNGIGFDPANKEKIFGLFKRMHTHVDGSGVGLYLLKKIVETGGGKIEAESEVGVGSVFKVYIKN